MTTQLETTTRANRLLNELAVHERNAIHRAADVVALEPGDVLLGTNAGSEQVFFPITGVVSLRRILHDGSSMEIALIGNEGLAGLDVFMASRMPLDNAVVLNAGSAYRITADELRRQMSRGGGLPKALLRFTYGLFSQVAQNAVCIRTHPAEARLARWLMLVSDRTSSLRFRVDAGATAAVLALPPASAAAATGRLRGAVTVDIPSGTITITSRERLEVSACECSETASGAYARTAAS